MPLSPVQEAALRLSDRIAAEVDSAFAQYKEWSPQDLNALLDSAIQELDRRRVAAEPLPPPASSLISPRPTSGPLLNLGRVPVLDASGRPQR